VAGHAPGNFESPLFQFDGLMDSPIARGLTEAMVVSMMAGVGLYAKNFDEPTRSWNSPSSAR
jgi:hypothetical protein